MRLTIERIALIITLSISLIIGVGFSAATPVFPYLVLALKGILKQIPELTTGTIAAHEGAVEFGALMAAFMVTRAPIAAFSGTLSDIIGRKNMIVLGMALYALTSLGMILVNDVLSLILLRALTGIASGITWPVAEAYLADVTNPSNRGKALSLYVMTQNFGDIIGPGIGAAVYKLYIQIAGPSDYLFALKSPFLIMALLSFISTGLAFMLPKIEFTSAVKTLRAGFKEIARILKELPSEISRSIKTIYVNGVANGIAMGVMNTALIVYIVEKVIKDPAIIGSLLFIMGVAGLPITMISGYLSDRFSRRKPFILFSYIISRPAIFLVPFITDWIGILLTMLVFTTSFSMGMPLMRTLQAELVGPEVRGTIFGLQQLFFNTGMMVGAMLGSYLVAIYAPHEIRLLGFRLTGYIVPFWFSGAIMVATTVLFALYVIEVGVKASQT